MNIRRKTPAVAATFLAACLGTSALTPTFALAASVAEQNVREFSIEPQPLQSALLEFSRQSQSPVVASTSLLSGLKAPAVSGRMDEAAALNTLLAGSGLYALRGSDGGWAISRKATDAPQSGSAAGGGAEVEALIVTAQKREEDIQDVPIAISAFSQEDLTRSQIAGGPDLITQVPNMTFTKTNFSSYSIQLRGIGTQAISATTDPAVAVAFNNTPFIRNRFFEQEFYDLQRVEVLRGPQGTLYGRNATAGVVNIISQKPKFAAEAKASADLSNYSSSRIEGMVNIPLVEDAVALRIAGAWTKRDGYATNEITGRPIDGRDLWSTRVSLRVSPNDRIDANLIWEHFQEDDDRLRSGKQLCKKDVVTEVAGFPVGYYDFLPNNGFNNLFSGVQATFSQGCERVSLYSPDAFQTPNGIMLPYYWPLGAIGLPTVNDTDPNAPNDQPLDPYLSTTQSRDLRVIESTIDPEYRAKSDIAELQVAFDLSDTITLYSETAYGTDVVFSTQDFNRFNTAPGAWRQLVDARPGVQVLGDNGNLFFCDPQLGCSDRLVAQDLSTAKARQFSQEFRLASDFRGPFNFSIGANYLRGDSEDKYYVFINSLTQIAAIHGLDVSHTTLPQDNIGPYVVGETDNTECMQNGTNAGYPDRSYTVVGCTYIDPNPIGSLNDRGHNYFLSRNPYKLISYALFGEGYYNLTDNLKITAGLRWTVDKKDAPRIPTWILAGQSVGYPVAEVIEQEWREPTGRLAVDWKPDLPFTDQTLLYASYAHGYKAGGANPPGFVRVYYSDSTVADANTAASLTRPRTFDPEFVDAFELGSKNTLADGRVTLNLAAFYYDYKDYQISEIVDRSAFNRNFDATVWGVELEADWRPIENLRLGFKGGYEKTRIADGEQAIDLMDRTAGDPRWTLTRPFPTFASSCILPTWLYVGNDPQSPANPELVGLGGVGGGNPGGCELAYVQGVDPGANFSAGHAGVGVINYTAFSTNPDDYPGVVWAGGVVTDRTYPGWDPSTAPNNGEGIAKPLGGNQLPNAPNWTATITADYTIPLPSDWLMNLHTDLHWQSESWWRVFNDHEYDKLDEYFTMNLAAIFTNEEAGWTVMAYVKNVTDETAITGAFLNSDDTALTTNVFLTEPRLYGLRVTKAWTGGTWFDSFAGPRDGRYPLKVEIGGQVQRHDAPQEIIQPVFIDEFPAALDVFGNTQRDNLDWGDGRDIKVSWRPNGGVWQLTAGVRYGKTNGDSFDSAQQETPPVCALAGYYAFLCDIIPYPVYTSLSVTNWSEASVRGREEHQFIDFEIARDVGLGRIPSTLGVSLRQAHLESTAATYLTGAPDWNIMEGWLPCFGCAHLPATHTQYTATLLSTREFEGVGPILNWELLYPLIKSDAAGRLGVDVRLSAGALFGKQKTANSGQIEADYFNIDPTNIGAQINANGPDSSAPPISLDSSRSESVTVPTIGVTLGLSYEIGRVGIGAGYRWERYFDAIDGGIDEHKDADRTIDGPYFKIAVGFGG